MMHCWLRFIHPARQISPKRIGSIPARIENTARLSKQNPGDETRVRFPSPAPTSTILYRIKTSSGVLAYAKVEVRIKVRIMVMPTDLGNGQNSCDYSGFWGLRPIS